MAYPFEVDAVNVYYSDDQVTLHHGRDLDVLRTLPDQSVNCVVTSPPYFGLRDYGVDGQRGLEASPAEYVAGMVEVFAEVRRVLADDGTCWLNLGDSYATGPTGPRRSSGLQGTPNAATTRAGMGAKGGIPEKNLLGIPHRVVFALQDDGWIWRKTIVWHKPNAMPESVTDRPSSSHEYLFILTKARRYWFDLDAIREPLQRDGVGDHGNGFRGQRTLRDTGPNSGNSNPTGRNPGDVWTIPTTPYPGAHFAVMAPRLAEQCILAGCKPGGTVLDPYSGVGTTGMVALRHGHRYIGIDIDATNHDKALRTRLQQGALIPDTEVTP